RSPSSSSSDALFRSRSALVVLALEVAFFWGGVWPKVATPAYRTVAQMIGTAASLEILAGFITFLPLRNRVRLGYSRAWELHRAIGDRYPDASVDTNLDGPDSERRAVPGLRSPAFSPKPRQRIKSCRRIPHARARLRIEIRSGVQL